MNPAVRAFNRFGLGARPGEPARLGDPRDWLRAQVQGGAPQIADPAVDARQALAEARREAAASRGNPSDELRRLLRRREGAVRVAEGDASLTARVTSERPFVERLVAFWSNHLCVSHAGNLRLGALVGPYEREVIRPHVLGRFEDMLLASAKHPAMLLYLDNAESTGPNSRAGRASAGRARPRGLNENYARELLELHTLGVDGGYTQEDVIELARVLTGWGVGGGPARARAAAVAVTFSFAPERHEPGARTLLGKRYPDEGVGQGEAVIRDLCAHPSTARFVATKLVRHFVADEPPARAVEAVTEVFARSGGDLAQTAAALIELPEAWDVENRKLRTPQDWLVAVVRAVGAERAPVNLHTLLVALRQPLWAPPAPKGWGDTRAEWADPDSLMNRAELARRLGSRADRGIEPASLLDKVETTQNDHLHTMLEDGTIGRSEKVALVLASPAFQWR